MLRRSTLHLQERRGKVNSIRRIAIELDEHGAIKSGRHGLFSRPLIAKLGLHVSHNLGEKLIGRLRR